MKLRIHRMLSGEKLAVVLPLVVVFATVSMAVESWPSSPSNLGFEDGTNCWHLPKALWRVADGEGRGGSKAIVWENSDSKRYLYPRQTLSLEVGGIYRFGAWVKVDSLKAGGSEKPKPRVSLDFANAAGKWIGADYAHPVSKPDADGWVRYECVTGPLGVEVVRGNLFGFLPRGSTGRVRFDDFSFSQEGTRRVDNMVSSAYRDTAESGPVTFVATLFIDPAKLPADSLSPVFVFRNADGVETEVAPDVFDAVHAAVTLDVSRLAAGAHPVTFVLRTKADGRELDRISCTFTRTAVRRRVSFDRFGRTLVDGKPFFPLGMYARDVTPEVLALYTNGTPYNCIMPYHMPSNEMLDACRDAGLMVICSVKDFVYGAHVDHERFRSREDSFRHIAGMVRAAKGHPATLAWYTNDESPPRQVAIQRDLCAMIHDLDPDHPVWHVTDRKNKIAPFLGAYDVIGMDPYPVGREGDMGDIGKASRWVKDVQECTFDTVPVWHVPQAFNWAWDTHRKRSKLYRYPTAEELVSMTWQPIAAGANGLIYYAFHRICMATKGAEREECLRLAAVAAAEVKARMPLILSDPGPKVESTPQGMVCRTWATAPGRVTLLVANSTRNPVSGTVTLAGFPPQSIELPPLGHVFIDIVPEKRQVQNHQQQGI